MYIKKPEEIEKMKVAGKILSDLFKMLEEFIVPGKTTEEIDKFCHEFIVSSGAIPSFLNYEGFPKSICTSINEVVVHGIPSNRVLKEGDIIGIDLGACYEGYHADAARTYPVGKISEEKRRLIEVTKECFFEGIKNLKAGVRIGVISNAIQKHAEENGYTLVRELVGHGIGKHLHEDPNVPNYGSKDSGPVVLENACLAIEPMVNMGKRNILLERDEWTIITKDKKPSAHYENTVLVTKEGVEILTL